MLLERINLESDEKVIAIVRKHWWIIAIETVAVVIMAALPATITNILFLTQPFGEFVNYAMFKSFLLAHGWELIFIHSAWLLAMWLVLANFWTDYYLDLWAITNRRVVLVDQRGFFRRFISSFRLERLQDMNIEVNGVLATLLDYGTIEAQTAGGSNEEFISHYMPKPRDIKAMIVRAADKLNEQQRTNIDQMKEQGL